jgi:prepilin-type N-terminal cleavage/methylation domain-containing protein
MAPVRPRIRGGFTLVELMIVVAILTVVVSLAVVSYGKYIRKATKAEVTAMLGEIRVKEEAYFAENGYYASTAADEKTIYPAVLDGNGLQTHTWTSSGAWADLGVNPPRTQLYCGYNAFSGKCPTGTACATYTPGTMGVTILGTSSPTAPWFYARACCDFNSPFWAASGSNQCDASDSTNFPKVSSFSISYSDNVLREEDEGN